MISNGFEKNGESSRSQGIYLPSDPAKPRPCLTNDSAVSQWHTTPGYQAFWGWIKRRCERIKGKEILRGQYHGDSQGIRVFMDMVESMMRWVAEVPIQPQSSQRFGNLAFRTYVKLVEARLPALFNSSNIPDKLVAQLLPLLLNSYAFGHPVRIDYGTGHELAFVLALWVCVISGWIGSEGAKEDEEDELILRVFTKYLDLTTLLQKTYRLEPAGSHGVWGLDDYCFLPYLFGSAQLLDGDLSPSESHKLASSFKSQSTNNSSSPTAPEEIKDLYTLSLYHLTLFKSGAAFSEHSPMLHSLSQMPNWVKIHSGLRKMFTGEVTGKRVVVQGLWIGGWLWGEVIPEAGRQDGTSQLKVGLGLGGEGTKAPWAR
ncbi:uncharacterized protein I303_100705 [Kwoniella dejecticola CBS 10117]|uniref:Serine/threonine-protein phosphatase 2A activator n=1 Tax=Kwoniella dejecticola CBS 10117 TaxID=1296121 RepID=A0A1A6AFP4_9TREE|nr:serine/threonine-protein phosphatase 2A activator 1 [Kwoniella dejecticola CBS 10117]OBR88890.1 serine/threonine-protein phosphatase 2A activator 1 [Kwoniella dejecticola CBS 10117]